MPTEHQFTMLETRLYRVTYTVEAETKVEAREMAEIGDTVEEFEEVLIGVIDRQIVS